MANVTTVFSFLLYLWGRQQRPAVTNVFKACLKELSRAYCINKPKIIKDVEPELLEEGTLQV